MANGDKCSTDDHWFSLGEECSIVLQSVAWQRLECLELGDNCSDIVASTEYIGLSRSGGCLFVALCTRTVCILRKDLRGGSCPAELLVVFSIFLSIPCFVKHLVSST